MDTSALSSDQNSTSGFSFGNFTSGLSNLVGTGLGAYNAIAGKNTNPGPAATVATSPATGQKSFLQSIGGPGMIGILVVGLVGVVAFLMLRRK